MIKPKLSAGRLPALFAISVLGAALAMVLVACGEEEPTYPEVVVNEPSPEDLAKGSVVSGSILWEGRRPRRRKLSMGDAYCMSVNENPLSEKYVIGDDGGLRDVFVYVKQGLEDYTFANETTPAVVDQINCVYKPHVIGVRVHQPVQFRNSDATAHNVHVEGSQGFNKVTASKGSSFIRQFKRPQLEIMTKCDIHPWMKAWIHVVDQPYFAVSDEEGKWAFPRPLPPGTYTLEAVHAGLGKKSFEVTVEEGKPFTPLVQKVSR